MAGLGEGVPLHLRQAAEEGDKNTVLCFVIAAIEQERRDIDLVNVVDNGPIFKRTSDMEL